ncbi:hypothetical protein [Paucibacter soli]|uniref:hypothetical protein n=1 Tax=Paucibacter soli TaxID=3133433 RepID=UPI003095C688
MMMMKMMGLLRWPLALGLAANGLLMLLAPGAWYAGMPGVFYTGPLNEHFVRDIGCAYLVAAAGLLWRALQPQRGAAAALMGAGFLLLHAGVHVWELATGRCGWGQFLRDVPGVPLAALAAQWLGWPERELRHAR